MATHSSTLAWRIPWTEEPGGPWCIRLQSRTLYLQTMYLWKRPVINERILKAKKIRMPAFSKIKKWRKHVVLPFPFLFHTPILFSKHLCKLVHCLENPMDGGAW